MRHKGLKVMVIMMFLFCGNAYGENQLQLTIPMVKDTNRDFLEIFTEEEKCIILAFEPQLDVFAQIYVYHFKDKLSILISDITLFDVGSLYYNSGCSSLDGFLDYLCKPMLDKTVNLDVSSFKKKVREDHNFIKKMRNKKDDEDDFMRFLFQIYQEILKSPQAKAYLERIEKELKGGKK